MITISGVISDRVRFTNGLYMFEIKCKRNTGILDEIPVLITEGSVPEKWCGDLAGRTVRVTGEIHSRMRLNCNAFYVKAKNIESSQQQSENLVDFWGIICKPPIYRKTPLGREIADLMVAINRQRGESDYIPCIAWGNDAILASKMKTGDKIQLHGRAQSRKYSKKTNETEIERVTYEISVSKMEVLK